MIGVFDSGIGGLTVLKELLKELPQERFVYFGDTARLPYGTKSPDTVLGYSREIADFLLRGRWTRPKKQPAVKMIVVACNTASALAAPTLQKELPVPVIGVVASGCMAAAHLAPKGAIAVIGTKSTIKSSVYAQLLSRLAPKAKVTAKACPLFVSLVEEGWMNHPITTQIAKIYLGPIVRHKPDVLILGCTHYPMLHKTIKRICGPNTTIVDSPATVAEQVKEKLVLLKLAAAKLAKGPRVKFFVSDDPYGFQHTARLFLGRTLPGPVQLAKL